MNKYSGCYKWLVLSALGLLGLAGCNSSNTAVTAAICADAATLQASTVALNKNQQTALQGIVTTCASTAGGTVFNNTTLAIALINDAILLQSSGLLSNVHITAEAPEAQQTLRQIRAHWQKIPELRRYIQ